MLVEFSQEREPMKINVVDGSNYFRGLLLLIRKDRKIAEPEVRLMERIGKALGFGKEFYDNAIHDILENEYIEDAPPMFSSEELAVRFIKDGLSLSISDNDFDPSEEEWLRMTAVKNGLGMDWFTEERRLATTRRKPEDRLEVEDLTVEYS